MNARSRVSISSLRLNLRQGCLFRQYSQGTNREALRYQLPKEPIRTRFAPSPTGYLHLGSLRTALYNFLAARHTGGQFVLRIEDTDEKRTVPDAERRIYEDLRWAGLQWDEGPDIGGLYGSYRQSERTSIYRHHAQHLLESGHAYRCFCSAERLREMAEKRNALGLTTDYDGTCEAVSQEEAESRAHSGERHVVRLRMKHNIEHTEDLVHGRRPQRLVQSHTTTLASHNAELLDSPILLKSDGNPTYHFANVVDDHLMKITHVIRGQEWLSSTPKHLYLFNAFGWTPPKYAHVGLLLDESGQKLSKRNGDIDVSRFREELDVLPATLNNFLALMGWSHRLKDDRMSLNELIENFSLKLSKGNVITSLDKLWYLQKRHVQDVMKDGGSAKDDLIKRIRVVLRKAFPALQSLHPQLRSDEAANSYIGHILRHESAKFSTSANFVDDYDYYLLNSITSSNKVEESKAIKNLALPSSEAIKVLGSLDADSWERSGITTKIGQIQEMEAAVLQKEGRGGIDSRAIQAKVHAWLRDSITGGKPCNSTALVMQILGRYMTLQRLNAATFTES